MITRGQFRHDTAVRRMEIDLTVQRMAQQTPFGIEQGDTGLVAGCLNSQNQDAAMVPIKAGCWNNAGPLAHENQGCTF